MGRIAGTTSNSEWVSIQLIFQKEQENVDFCFFSIFTREKDVPRYFFQEGFAYPQKESLVSIHVPWKMDQWEVSAIGFSGSDKNISCRASAKLQDLIASGKLSMEPSLFD